MNDVVENNEFGRRFELRTSEGHAELQYHYRGPDTIVLVHTDVSPELQGRGLAGKLAHAALEFARTNKLGVVPVCPFVQSYLERHPEYADLVRE
ncbi:MAG TPA: GNAT family N-acetyltransferase [Gemmatimonadaceae bacterium]